MRNHNLAVGRRPQPPVTLIGPERIAPCRHHIERRVKGLARQPRIGRSTLHFLIQRIRHKRPGTGPAKHMLRQHIQPARPERLLVEVTGQHRIARRHGFQIFKAVARHDQRPARRVQPVVGAARALHQPRRALGRAHLDDQVHIAPVDAQVEAGGRHDGPQPPFGHGRLHLAPRVHRQAAMVDADGQQLLIGRPQLLEDQLGQRPCVHEHDGQPRRFDPLHHRARRPAAIVA